MADLPPAGTPHERHFTHRERREVVVQHEATVGLPFDRFDLLLVIGGAERDGDERLRFATRKHGRPVRARQHADLRPDGPDLVELAAVEPHALFQNFVAQNLFLQFLEDRFRFDLPLHFALGNVGHEVFEHLVDGAVAFQLVPHAHRFAQRHEHFLFDLAVERVVDLLFRRLSLRLAGFLREVVDRRDDALDGGVAGFERLHDVFFAHFLGAGFHHHQAIIAARNHEIEAALPALLVGRIDDELAVDLSDADTGNRLLERNARDGQRGGGAGERQHVRVVVRVGREHQGDNLRLVLPAGGEERPNRPIDHAARQHFLFRRLAFALEEPAGDATRCVGVFLVIDRQRKKVDAFARVRRRAGRHEHDRVAHADQDRSVGLLGELARFE